MRRSAPGLLRALGRDDGMTLIELTMALFVLVVGILSAFTAFASSQKLSLVSERHASMTQIAQREIERIEGLSYSQIGEQCGGSGQQACPQQTSDSSNPDFYVGSGGTTFMWDRTGGASEPLDLDSANGTVLPVQTWDQTSDGGLLGGQIYDFVTWSTDSQCSGSCPSSNDYKRITVAVTMAAGVHPDPVYVSSVISDPNAGSHASNPPPPTCTLPSGTTGPCNTPLTGNPNIYYLHDWPANVANPVAPSADHALHNTVGVTTGGVCTPTQSLASGLNIAGCPIPDVMDGNSPTGSTIYDFSTDVCSDTVNCPGRVAQSTGTGTGSASDCTNGAWGTLTNSASGFWVTPALGSALTLNGAGGVTMWTQTVNTGGTAPNPAPTISFCIEIYDVPPDGSSGSLKDIFAWPPVAKGGAAYVPPTNPTTGGNWPTSISETSFVFTFSGQSVTIPQGDRIGVRIWEYSESPSAPIDVLYDTANYPSQLQLNSQ